MIIKHSKEGSADASNTATEGLGAGVSIAKNIFEAHGVRIWVQRTPGKGTKVRFSLPILFKD